MKQEVLFTSICGFTGRVIPEGGLDMHIENNGSTQVVRLTRTQLREIRQQLNKLAEIDAGF